MTTGYLTAKALTHDRNRHYSMYIFLTISHSMNVIDAFTRELKKREDALSMPLRDP